uniref:phosphoserine phosphatase n=1 Tax=Tetraselmis sp. GSL018 TaxID=582737 RepID=A0A061S231_9CHLO|mmetsp:Transcript_34141/g.80986  ORF Transcript_34141/g.80986 Transcript_34141/m.80986 type:complete len:300 (+) Transcript_34141:121-1020(+)
MSVQVANIATFANTRGTASRRCFRTRPLSSSHSALTTTQQLKSNDWRVKHSTVERAFSMAVLAVSAGKEDTACNPSPTVLSTWKAAEAVAFDVDSTLCADESIDELASFLGCGQQIKELTSRAMGGSMKFEEALKLRLDLMQVSQADMRRFIDSHPPLLSPGIPELVGELHAQGKSVFLVSGGFREIINPIAEILSIPRDNVFANTILYKEDGSYAGFDDTEFTSRSRGKPAALAAIKERHGIKSIVMVGDGATDLEARQEGIADLFIGYGGVVTRESIAQAADWYVKDLDGLIAALRG